MHPQVSSVSTWLVLVLASLLAPSGAQGRTLPEFIDPASIEDAEFECLGEPVSYDAQAKPHLDVLWRQALKYLEGYAVALTTVDHESCDASARAMRETNTPAMTGPTYQCIMDNRDMQLVVKHIYAILENPEKARTCFAAREEVDWMFTPSEEMERSSKVAQYFKRVTLDEYYAGKKDAELRKEGLTYAKNFRTFVTHESVRMPDNFPFDVSARALPDLWAAAGWVPMYSNDDPRSLAVGMARTRGGYAYAEVLGHWGLLRILKINGERVGAEIGMTAQIMGSFYPYHHHAIGEIYHTIREPACLNSVRNLVLTPPNGALVETSRNGKQRVVELNGAATPNVHKYWSQTTTRLDPLLYIPENSIHAFDLSYHCEADPDERAHVTVWARGNADVESNDYGNTVLCELKDATLPKHAANSIYPHLVCRINHLHY